MSMAAPLLVHAANVLNEMLVTARKREESPQETPVAISALSGEQLANGGQQSGADLRTMVPKVDVYGGSGITGVGNFFMRGVGARHTGINSDSGVSIYLDGMYIGRANGAIL